MGVGKREFVTFLCDACGREIIAEEGAHVDGYYVELVRVQDGSQVSADNVYACSATCFERACHDALNRETLPQEEKLSATQELWLKGRKFTTNPMLPVVDVRDETRVIGTAKEISRHVPTQERRPVPHRRAPDALDPDWQPEPPDWSNLK